MDFEPYIEPVDELCKKYKVHRLYLLGSVLTDKFGPKSDIDFYVEFHIKDTRNISGLKCGLQRLMGHKTDLHVTPMKRWHKEPHELIYEGDLVVPEKKTTFVNYVMDIKGKAPVTVALPVWNSKDICWLSMESLCRQNFPFELIVFEEIHPKQLGRDWFFDWKDKLTECTRIVYITNHAKLTLAEKWCGIAEAAESTAFCLCGCDDYYHEDMCRDAYKAISEGYEYVYDISGYFYHIRKKETILYMEDKYKGLMQAVPTEKLKKVQPEKKNSGVDRWIHDRIKPRKKLKNPGPRCVCTDGMNNISHRDRFYDKLEKPFYFTNRTIFDLLPFEVADKLMKL